MALLNNYACLTNWFGRTSPRRRWSNMLMLFGQIVHGVGAMYIRNIVALAGIAEDMICPAPSWETSSQDLAQRKFAACGCHRERPICLPAAVGKI